MTKHLSVERSIALLSLSLVTGISSCGQASSTKPQIHQTNSNNSKPTAPTWKITINSRPVGTTDNPAELTDLLKKVMKERYDNRVFKPGTTDVETDVYLNAEPTIGIAEVLRIRDVVSEAGSRNVLLPIEIPESQAANLKPSPLTLLVTIGEVKIDQGKVLGGGIEILHDMTLKHSEKNTIPKEFVVLFVPKDGEYMIGDKPVAPATLTAELRPRIQQLDADRRRLNVIIDEEGDVRYRSLAEVAYGS